MGYKYMKDLPADVSKMDKSWNVSTEVLLREAFNAYLKGEKNIAIGIKDSSLYIMGMHFPEDALSPEKVWIEEIPPGP